MIEDYVCLKLRKRVVKSSVGCSMLILIAYLSRPDVADQYLNPLLCMPERTMHFRQLD